MSTIAAPSTVPFATLADLMKTEGKGGEKGTQLNRVRLDICDGIDNGIVANVAALRFECLRRGGV